MSSPTPHKCHIVICHHDKQQHRSLPSKNRIRVENLHDYCTIVMMQRAMILPDGTSSEGVATKKTDAKCQRVTENSMIGRYNLPQITQPCPSLQQNEKTGKPDVVHCILPSEITSKITSALFRERITTPPFSFAQTSSIFPSCTF